MSWRISAEEIFKFLSKEHRMHDVYMFGVYTGESVCDIINLLKKYNKSCTYYNFDSFIGLPNEDKEDRTKEGWVEGEFDAQKAFGTSSVKDTIAALEAKIRKDSLITTEPLKFFPGFYNESLTKDLIEKENMRPALYVDIDCDLYSSTIDALGWMFSNKLIIPGTIIGYDDWGGTPGWFANQDGESKAHAELCQQFKVKARKVFQAGSRYPHVHTMFLIESIG